jgi:hypothetical protein
VETKAMAGRALYRRSGPNRRFWMTYRPTSETSMAAGSGAEAFSLGRCLLVAGQPCAVQWTLNKIAHTTTKALATKNALVEADNPKTTGPSFVVIGVQVASNNSEAFLKVF